MRHIILVLPKQSWRQIWRQILYLEADHRQQEWDRERIKAKTKDASKGSRCDGLWGSPPLGPLKKDAELPTAGLCKRSRERGRPFFVDPEPSLVGGSLGCWSLQDAAQTSLVLEKAKSLVPEWMGWVPQMPASFQGFGVVAEGRWTTHGSPCPSRSQPLNFMPSGSPSGMWPGKAQGGCGQADGSSASCPSPKRNK